MDCSPPGFSVHGILQARKWSGLSCPPPGDLPNPGTKPPSLVSPALAGGFLTISATWEARANLISGFRLSLHVVFVLLPSTHFIFLSFLCLYKFCDFKYHSTLPIVQFRKGWVPAPTEYNKANTYLGESNTV